MFSGSWTSSSRLRLKLSFSMRELKVGCDLGVWNVIICPYITNYSNCLGKLGGLVIIVKMTWDFKDLLPFTPSHFYTFILSNLHFFLSITASFPIPYYYPTSLYLPISPLPLQSIPSLFNFRSQFWLGKSLFVLGIGTIYSPQSSVLSTFCLTIS